MWVSGLLYLFGLSSLFICILSIKSLLPSAFLFMGYSSFSLLLSINSEALLIMFDSVEYLSFCSLALLRSCSLLESESSTALFLPFLGETAAVNMGPAVLAVRGGAIIWPGYIVRVGEKADRYLFCQTEPLRPEDYAGPHEEAIAKVAAYYTKSVEDIVRRYPEQWFWMHNRWKTRPPAELEIDNPKISED